jgi:acetyl-CoA carboxylase carboxyltransferase component
MMALNERLDEISAQMLDVGDRQRATAIKRDKCLPRERINSIIDEGSPFLEIG